MDIADYLKFQTLIGTVKSPELQEEYLYKRGFQTLIGTVKSSWDWPSEEMVDSFQTLIGTVKRVHRYIWAMLET